MTDVLLWIGGGIGALTLLLVAFRGGRRLVRGATRLVVPRIHLILGSLREAILSPFRPEVSLVVACFNVRSFIGDFFESVFTQRRFTGRYEIIIVDDGSTDGLGEVVARWQEKHPRVIHYVRQDNSGVAAARNAGAEVARGKWISFPDPDDFFADDYFRSMARAVRSNPRTVLAFSPMVYFVEETGEFLDEHPLSYRFAGQSPVRVLPQLGDWIVASTATSWILRKRMRALGICFDSAIIPGSEDGHVANRLLANSPGMSVVAVPDARYFYRKRASSDSLMDTAASRVEWFADELEYGHVALLKSLGEELVDVPVFVQRWSLYVLVWKIRHLFLNPEALALLGPERVKTFDSLVREVLNRIEPSIISAFALARVNDVLRVGLLWRYRRLRKTPPFVYLEQADTDSGMCQFSYVRGPDDFYQPTVLVNGQSAPISFPSRSEETFLTEPFIRREFFWVSLNEKDSIAFDVEGIAAVIRSGPRGLGEQVSYEEMVEAVRREPFVSRTDVAPSSASNHFSRCWIFIDSESRADDNAEHLYRYVLNSGRRKNCYFVLSRTSKDWERLEKEGFSLLDWGSDDHLRALESAEILVSSHLDHHILFPCGTPPEGYGYGYKFVFLQHGVTKDDFSEWFNKKPIRLLVTATPNEAESIWDENSPYRFSRREVILTGFPRHDSLLAKAHATAPQKILLMPTWRRSLTKEEPADSLGLRGTVDEFWSSEWAANWMALLHSADLRDSAQRHGMDIIWAPHPQMAMYLKEMVLPDWVTTVDVRNAHYQELLAQASVAVTDYSSVAFDVAYLNRPVVYFHFEDHETASDNHIWKPGYFSYAEHGFGPVATNVKQAVSAIDRALSGGEDPQFERRRLDTFPWRDGRCSERVFNEIVRLV